MNNNQNTFFEDIKHQIKTGDMTIRLIFINTVVFLFIGILTILGSLLLGSNQLALSNFTTLLFSLNTDLSQFIYSPWGLLTSIFAHFSFFHFLMNMLMLYFSGKMFEQIFDGKRLVSTYILGGIGGGIFELIAHSIFPVFQNSNIVIVGASGSIMSIFMALAFYRPNLQVNLFGILPIKIIFLAGIFFVMDMFSLASQDGTAHFAHIGGAIIGIISIKNLDSKSNLVNLFQRFIESIVSFFTNIFAKKEPKFIVKKGGGQKVKNQTDEEYNYEMKQRQIQVDKILDKIAKSGYESLSKAEKEFLFNQSQNIK